LRKLGRCGWRRSESMTFVIGRRMAGVDVKRTWQSGALGVAIGLIPLSSGQRRNAQSPCESGPSPYLLGAALVERVRGFLQDIFQIFVQLPSNDVDSFIAKLSEGRNRPIVFKSDAILGTFQKQDPNGGVEIS
jgi:hypothetical protein